jgi:hypothetical protein
MFTLVQVLLTVGILSQVALGIPSDAMITATVNIRNEVKRYAPKAAQCQGTTCCTVSSTESCSVASMTKDETTLVLPGGNTRCIYSYSTPFAFQVWNGL